MELQQQIDRLLARRASEWHLILEYASEAQRAEFVQWLKQSPLHVREYLEAVYTDRVLDHVDTGRLEDCDTLLTEVSPALAPFEDKLERDPSGRGEPPGIRGPRRWRLATAAGLATLAIAALLAYQQLRPHSY